jgi:serine/threonine-protein kinase
LAPGRSSPDGTVILANKDKDQYDRAIANYNEAIRLKPSFAGAYNGLAWLLATSKEARWRDGAKAVDMAEQAVALRADEPNFIDSLAAAYAEAGQFTDAVKTEQSAIGLLRAQGHADKIANYEKHLRAYEASKPWRE